MLKSNSTESNKIPNSFWFIYIFWLIVVTISFYQNYTAIDINTEELAKIIARANFNKDQALRYWASKHGGIYVPLNQRTPANPNLAHIPDRIITKPNGDSLTLMNPAYMIRQMFDEFPKKYGVVGRIVSLKPLNVDNSPDKWEAEALIKFEKGVKEVSEFSNINGKPFLRLIEPMVTDESCLKCHGFQGYKIGDIRGGVGVSVPMTELYNNSDNQKKILVVWHLLFLIIGFVAIGISKKKNNKFIKAQLEIENALLDSEKRWKYSVEGNSDGLWDWNLVTNEVFFSPMWIKMLGYNKDEIKGNLEEWEKRVHPDDKERVFKDINEHINGVTEFYRNEHRVLCKDGSYKWILDRGKIIEYTEEGKPLRMIGTHSDISERIKLSEEAERNYKLLNELVKQVPGVLYQYQFYPDGRNCFPFASENIWDIYEVTPDEVKEDAAKVLSRLHPEDSDSVIEKIVLSFNTLEVWEDDYRVILPSKGVRWLRGVANPEKLEDGSVLWHGYIMDITERKKDENEIKNLLRHYQTLMNVSNEGIHILNDKGILVDCNKNFLNMLGYSFEESQGLEVAVWDAQWNKEELMKKLNGLFKNPEIFTTKHKCKDGKIIDVEINVADFEVNGEQFLYAASRNITDRLKSEEALKRSEEKYRQIYDNLIDVYLETSIDGTILEVSSSVKQIFNYEPSELIGTKDTNYFENPLEREKIIKLVEKKGKVRDYTVNFRRKDNKILVCSINVEIINDADNHPIKLIGVVRDITERMKIEKSIQMTSKLESIGTLAGGIAHDFNNLLSGIFGNIELAKLKEKDEKILKFLERTADSIERAQNLTSQLLTFSKGGEPIKKVEKLQSFLKEIVEFSLSGSTVTCKFNIAEDLYACNVDKNQIGQVIDNLVINSVQAMPNGGSIYLSAQNVVLEENHLGELEKGNYVKITLQDEGIGIPKDSISKIFDPFYTTKTKGHGIGLSSSYSIIKRHQGAIEVESELGIGTTFSIYLPAIEESLTEIETIDVEKHNGTGLFIVMDDENSIQEILEEVLSGFGYRVILASNGNETIEIVKAELNSGNKITGMIFDLTIPGGMGGKETVAEIRKIVEEIPIFVSSGYSDNPVMANPKEYGFTGSISKPFRIIELIELLNKHLKA